MTAFYLTDFLVRQFDAFVWKPMGLDRHPDLRDMYFGNYENWSIRRKPKIRRWMPRPADCAARLGLAYERRFTGYGDLTSRAREAPPSLSRSLAQPQASAQADTPHHRPHPVRSLR